LTPEGRPEGAPEMSFLKHKDAYQFPGGIYWTRKYSTSR
jgi:hypothetical protein